MKLKRIIAGISAVVVSVSAMSFSAFSTVAEEPANDVFDNLNQQQITEAMSPGWNVGNQLEATTTGTPSETAWQSTKITKELIQAVKAQGFKSVRIPVSYLDYIGDAPDYTINSDWLARVKEVVNYCVDEGLYAIINMHGDGYTTVYGGWMISKPRYTDAEINDEKTRVYYTDEEQVEINKKYGLVWEQIANTFKDYDEHLIFESMNEVFDGTYRTPDTVIYNRINDYNQIFVDTVRKTGGNNAKRWLLLPGWNTDINYTAGEYGFKLPTDTNRDASIPENEQRIMISVHYYAPYDFCGTENGQTTTWGTDAQIKELREQFKRCYAKFVINGYPVVIGEYGSIDKTPYNSNSNEYRKKYANEVCKAARSMGMIPVYWDNGWNGVHGFGLFNRETYEVTQQGIIDSIMDAYKGEAEPAPEVIKPMEKDEALCLIYSNYVTTITGGTADAEMAGATKIKYIFDCASDTSFNSWLTVDLSAKVAGTESKASVKGESDILGLTAVEAVLDLTNQINEGDSYSVCAYTNSWRDASDYVFLIRCIEFLDKDGNVIKTIDKSNTPSEPSSDISSKKSPNNPIQPSPTTASPTQPTSRQEPITNVKKATIKKLKVNSKKKKITVTWGKLKGAKGYQVQVSANKKFKKLIVNKKSIKKNKITIKHKKIKKGKTYYVRVRAFSTYKNAKGVTKKLYSDWKNSSKVKVK